jgi:membrane fusion protein
MAEPNKPLMTIVPEGDVLKAELFVSPRAIGLVAPGQTVHLSYSSFPYQQFGFARGKVETISYTLLKPDQSTSPIILTAPAYRVTVSLNQQTINANGKVIALQPDMQLDADILFDRRSLVAWIFGPILTPWQHS